MKSLRQWSMSLEFKNEFESTLLNQSGRSVAHWLIVFWHACLSIAWSYNDSTSTSANRIRKGLVLRLKQRSIYTSLGPLAIHQYDLSCMGKFVHVGRARFPPSIFLSQKISEEWCCKSFTKKITQMYMPADIFLSWKEKLTSEKCRRVRPFILVLTAASWSRIPLHNAHFKALRAFLTSWDSWRSTALAMFSLALYCFLQRPKYFLSITVFSIEKALKWKSTHAEHTEHFRRKIIHRNKIKREIPLSHFWRI